MPKLIKYEDYKNVIEETEEEFNAIIKAEKARAKKDGVKFDFRNCRFNFKFPLFKNKIENMTFYSWNKDRDKPTSERQKEKGKKGKARENHPENNNRVLETKSIEKLFEIINKREDSNIDIKVVGLEGCHVDVAVRIKGSNEDIWCSIQIKSSNAKIPQFMMKRYKCPEEFKDSEERFGYYEYMLTICHNMKNNKFLVIPPHSNEDIEMPEQLTYSSGVTKGFGVSEDDIYNIMVKYISDYSAILGKKYRELQLLCNEKCKLEVEHIHLRIDTFSEIFDMTEISGCAVDFIINGDIRVQEKTRNHYDVSGNSFQFIIKKRDGNKHQPYAINDNDFYWFNLADTNYFYVIPSKLLERDEKIRETLTLHKEFNIITRGIDYNDAWTYDFRFDRTNPEDRLALWCVMNDFKEIYCSAPTQFD